MTRSAGHAGAASDEPDQAADRQPDAGERRRRQPEDGRRRRPASTDVARRRARSAMPIDDRDDDRLDGDRGEHAEPAAHRPARPARRGVDSTTSSRRPSFVAEPSRPGTIAPARPMMNEPKLKNVSWSSADGWSRSMSGIQRAQVVADLRAATEITSANASADADDEDPVQRRCRRPTRSRCPSRSASCRRERAADARRQRRQPQPGDDRRPAPRSRRSKATTPTARSTDVDGGEQADRRPVGDAGERSMAGRPVEERQRLERVDERRQGRVRRR